MTRPRKAYFNTHIEALIDDVCRKKPHEPVDRAESQVVFIYAHGNSRGYERLVMDKTTVPDAELLPLVLDALERVHVHEFVLADDSCGLMDRLVLLTERGYAVCGTYAHRLTEFHVVQGLVFARILHEKIGLFDRKAFPFICGKGKLHSQN